MCMSTKRDVQSKEELMEIIQSMAKEGRARLEKMGIKETDIPEIIHKSRGVK